MSQQSQELGLNLEKFKEVILYLQEVIKDLEKTLDEATDKMTEKDDFN